MTALVWLVLGGHPDISMNSNCRQTGICCIMSIMTTACWLVVTYMSQRCHTRQRAGLVRVKQQAACTHVAHCWSARSTPIHFLPQHSSPYPAALGLRCGCRVLQDDPCKGSRNCQQGNIPHTKWSPAVVDVCGRGRSTPARHIPQGPPCVPGHLVSG